MLKLIAFLVASSVLWGQKKDITLQCEDNGQTHVIRFLIHKELIKDKEIFFEGDVRCGAHFSIRYGHATSGIALASEIQGVFRTGGGLALIEAMAIVGDDPKLCEGGLIFAYDYHGKIVGCDLVEGIMYLSTMDPLKYQPRKGEIPIYKILRHIPVRIESAGSCLTPP